MFGRLLERMRIDEILCLSQCVANSPKKNRVVQDCWDGRDWMFVVENQQSQTYNASV
jgi:hypothetical protein